MKTSTTTKETDKVSRKAKKNDTLTITSNPPTKNSPNKKIITILHN